MSQRISSKASLTGRLLVASVIFLPCLTVCQAQQEIATKVDKFIEAEMQTQRIPGLSVTVIKNGRVIVSKGYGFANFEHRVAVKPETLFQSGSIGKQFTATAVMMLVEEGKLSLDDNLSKYFSDGPESWKKITLRHLLTHTSGMQDYPPDFNLRRDYSEDELLAIIKSQPLAFQPGEQWSYSNLGYVALGILISKVTGRFYGNYLVERIFRPLGMGTARIISEADIIPNRAAGYRLVSNELKNQEWVAPNVNTTADGPLYLSVLDMARWDAGLYTEKLLKQSSLEMMWSPAMLNNGRRTGYGFGWHTVRAHGRRMVFHAGAWQGFKAFIVRFPEDKLAIIFFANLWQTHEFRVARGLIATIYPEFALPSAKSIDDKEPKVRSLVRDTLLKFAAGAADPSVFTPEARAKLFEDKLLTESLNSLSHPIAIIHSLELMDRRDDGGLRVYRYALTDLVKTLYCTVSLTKADQIAGLKLEEQ
ncbi:MAG: serine hydrolase domain-containing protein [Pyrinomonadaceae bacterium]